MSKLRIFSSILGMIYKRGKPISKPKGFFLDETPLSFPAIQILIDAKTDWGFKTPFTVFSAGVVSFASDVEEQEESENDDYELPTNLSIDDD